MKVEMEPRETEIFLELHMNDLFQYRGKTYIATNIYKKKADCPECEVTNSLCEDTNEISFPFKMVCKLVFE